MTIHMTPCTPDDAAHLLNAGLRACDLHEIATICGPNADAASVLHESIQNSIRLRTLRIDGQTSAILGVGWHEGMPGGALWMLACDAFDTPGLEVPIARHLRRVVFAWLNEFGALWNFADPEHEAALRLLRWLGFTLETKPGAEFGTVGGADLVLFWQCASWTADGGGREKYCNPLACDCLRNCQCQG